MRIFSLRVKNVFKEPVKSTMYNIYCTDTEWELHRGETDL